MNISLKKTFYIILLLAIIVFAGGLLWPENFMAPLQGTSRSYVSSKPLWFKPWGKTRKCRGVDIFAKDGTPVIASCSGLVIHSEPFSNAGNVVWVLGPKWRIHYYAHLKSIKVKTGDLISQGMQIGTVGMAGKADRKSPYLRYSIITLIPDIWRYNIEYKSADQIFISVLMKSSGVQTLKRMAGYSTVPVFAAPQSGLLPLDPDFGSMQARFRVPGIMLLAMVFVLVLTTVTLLPRSHFIITNGPVRVFRNIEDSIYGTNDSAFEILPPGKKFKIIGVHDALHFMALKVKVCRGVEGWIHEGAYRELKDQ